MTVSLRTVTMIGGLVRQQTQCSTGSLMTHTMTEMRIDKRGMLGDVVDWLGEACSSLDKRAEPTFSAPRAGLCNYLH